MAIVLSVTVLASVLSAVQPPAPAAALSGSDFEAGNIISNAEFYNGSAMTQLEIQRFLEARQPGSCTNSNCLKLLKMNTANKAQYFSDTSGKVECLPYAGGAGEPASTIIFKVQQACGISAKVILVTLQKEQGLLSNAGPSSSVLKRAMGMGCPDNTGGTCAAEYDGFFNQVYWGTRQLKTYQAAPNVFRYKVGISNQIQYSTATSCGTKSVFIENKATAALYNYTPYTPNAAALANLRGTASCGSYGNRNFWVFYNDWFGSPTDIRPQGIAPSRTGGVDRFETAVQISAKNFAPTTSTIYVSNGLNFPDALSAAPAAASQDAPLLLVRQGTISPAVKTEIKRLTPDRIVVVGGTGVISDAVYNELATLVPPGGIRRDAGVDRFESSRAIANAAFAGTGSDVAYIATGFGFADALSASAAAGSLNAPVILVDGAAGAPDAATTQLLSSLGVTKIVIAGGPGAVSSSMESALKALPGIAGVTRYGGADRYATSGIINRATFTASQGVHVASGLDFPDALAAAAVAGKNNAPLYLVRATCVNKPILQHMIDLGATSMAVYGGASVVGSAVEKFANCR